MLYLPGCFRLEKAWISEIRTLCQEHSEILRSVYLDRHLKRDAHKDAISQNQNTTIKMKSESNRNNAIALRVGCTCYKIYYRRRPYTDYEDEVFLLHKCGVDVGDINHSYKFPQKFLDSVAEVVKDNVKDYLKKPLPQTGLVAPPVKVIADKATYKHRTRQFVGLTSIIPDSDDLLQYMFLEYMNKHPPPY